MWNKTITAIFYAIIKCIITTTAVIKSIQRAVTKNTVKIVGVIGFMAGEIFAVKVIEKFRTVLFFHNIIILLHLTIDPF